MLSRQKIHHHFLPHFFASPEFADDAVGIERNQVYHRGHALSVSSLFVYLQLLVVFGITLFLLHVGAPQVLGSATFSPDQIISLTNQKRAENGLGALTYNPKLAQAAGAKAANMFSENYWAHNSPLGKTPWSFITAAGYRYVFAGENLARDFDSATSVVDAWMNSPTHRDNLLDKNFKEIGVAVSYGNLTGREGILVVQEFGAGVGGQKAEVSSKEATVSNTPVVDINPVIAKTTFSSHERGTKQSKAEIAQANTTIVSVQEPVVLASRQFSMAKTVSLALVVFIFLLFMAEVLITLRREKVNLRPGVLAHLLLLAFVLFALWYAVGGAIL